MTITGWNANTQFHGQGGQAGHADFGGGDFGGFSDFFEDLFRRQGEQQQSHGRGGRAYKQRGSDQEAKMSVTLLEAFKGATKTIQMQVPEIDENGQVRYQVRTIKVNIPKGALNGQRLRLANQGQGGGPSGDLYLEIEIASDARFTLEGRDIYLTLPVTPWEAALGADIKVPTLGGTVGLKLASGASSGQKLRLKGRGMPGKHDAGDQYVILQIQTPKADTDERRDYYQKMAEIMPFNPRKDWVM